MSDKGKVLELKEQQPTQVKRVKVTLKKEHIHRGKVYKPGATIEVREDQAQRLKEWGVIE